MDRVESLCREIAQDGGNAVPMRLDVSDPNDVSEVLGAHAFDIVVNNAGVAASLPALEHDAASIDTVIDTNLKGAFHVARAAAQAMIDAGRKGSIINIASILGVRVSGHVAAYAASKAGLVQLSRSLALEWARHGIRVNAICPGYIETELNREFFAGEAGQAMIKRIPQRRLGQPSDLDGALLLLASDLGGFMTGSEIVVDGGHLVSAL
jgi:NAD(P)-dependent dehydrogenase (short-subunit alcohol dehydrogenase family)